VGPQRKRTLFALWKGEIPGALKGSSHQLVLGVVAGRGRALLSGQTGRDIQLTRGYHPAIPAFWASFATALLLLIIVSLLSDIAMGGGDEWIPVCSSSELPEGKSKVSSSGVAVFRKNGMLYAIEDRCSHGR
jgi:hypothetical protein